LSRPNNWTPNRDHLATVSRDGQFAVRAQLKELSDAGYLIRERRRVGGGRFVWIGTVFEVSQGVFSPLVGNPPVDNPPVDNPPSTALRTEEQRSNKETTPPTPQPAAPVEGSEGEERSLSEVRAVYRELTRAEPRGKQAAAFVRETTAMLDDGYTVEEITGCMRALLRRNMIWTMGTVAKFIDRYRSGTLESPGVCSSLDLHRPAEHDHATYERRVNRKHLGVDTVTHAS
jgi:hypothetical protein